MRSMICLTGQAPKGAWSASDTSPQPRTGAGQPSRTNPRGCGSSGCSRDQRLDLARFGYQELLVAGRGFPDRLWAVNGLFTDECGVSTARRLLR